MDIYDRFLVVTANQALKHSIENTEEMFFYIEKELTASFGYIANRANRNDVDPRGYLIARQRFPNWKSMAIVAYSRITVENSQIEKQLLTEIPTEVFDSLESAMKWTHDYIGKVRSQENNEFA
ncbi:hypothetical protein VDG1235_1490 [Verrucomicrobiia bacterium DG1235]|nr:hypothetical protein VDG1235_1490 [Verrucomicrobiae bacterium DG1235]